MPHNKNQNKNKKRCSTASIRQGLKKPEVTFSSLPQELILYCLSFLDPLDAARLSMASKFFGGIVGLDKSYWMGKIGQNFPKETLIPLYGSLYKKQQRQIAFEKLPKHQRITQTISNLLSDPYELGKRMRRVIEEENSGKIPKLF